MSHLHIVRLDVENVMKIRAVEIAPGEEAVIPVVGANGSGKSSLLKAVEMAVGGKKVFPDRPLRDGAKKGHIVLDVGEYVIERTITEGGSYLKLVTADGVEVKEPQKVLDEITGGCADPMAFLALKPKEQRETLMSLAGLNFEKVDALRSNLFAVRTSVNRTIKSLEARVEAARGDWPDDLPSEPLSIDALATALRDAQRRVSARAEAGRAVDAAKDRVSRAEAELRAAYEHLASCQKELDAIPVAGTADVAAAEKKLLDAEWINKAVRARAAYRELAQELQGSRDYADTLTADIEKIDRGKAERLAAAKLPVPGLSVDDDGVLFNGVPLSQASMAERIRVGVAVALAGNPRFRVVLVRDGSLLDDSSRAMLEAAVKEHNAQMLLELVRSDDTRGVFLVDGELVKPST